MGHGDGLSQGGYTTAVFHSLAPQLVGHLPAAWRRLSTGDAMNSEESTFDASGD